MRSERTGKSAGGDQRENYYRGKVEPYGKRHAEFDSPSVEALFNLAWTYDVILGHLSRELARRNLSVSAFNVLMILHRTGGEGSRLNELSELLVVSRANVTGLVDSLEGKGLVRRGEVAGDRRARVARITKAGEKLIASVLPGYYTEVRRICSGLSVREKGALSSLLEKLRVSVRETGSLDVEARKGRKER